MKRISKWKKSVCLFTLLCLCMTSLTAFPTYAETKRPIATEGEFAEAFYAGGVYVLQNHITLTKPLFLSNNHEDGIFADGDISIDCNGFTITSSAPYGLTVGRYDGNITFSDFKNGGGITAGGALGAAICLSDVPAEQYNKTLTINGGRFIGSLAGIQIPSNIPKQQVQINQGIFMCTKTGETPIKGLCTINGTYTINAEGNCLTVGDPTEPTTSTTNQETTTQNTTQPVIPSAPTDSDNGEDLQKQAAAVNLNATIPGASYTISIPTTIPLPTMERAETDAPDKISETAFTVSISDMAHFFGEKAVHITLNTDYKVFHTENEAVALPYQIMQNDILYDGQTPFAQLNEQQTSQSGTLIIDRSAIRKSGKYQGTIEFEITLKEQNV